MKKKLFTLILGFTAYIFVFSTFIYFLSTTKNSDFVPSNFFVTTYDENYSKNLTAKVGTFTTDSTDTIDKTIIDFISNVYSLRNKAFLNGNVEQLYMFYDINQTFGSYSLKHEFKRIAYLRDWANERNITFKNIESKPTIKSLKTKDKLYDLILSEEYKIDYFYNDNPEKINTFAIKIVHNLELKNNDMSFIITKDYYEDYFSSGLTDYDFNLNEKDIPLRNKKINSLNFNIENYPTLSKNYNRTNAVNYANKYCGISFASDFINNSNYSIYTTDDKNSTNFISQCLSDKYEGGGLNQDKNWSYINTTSNKIKATSSWVKSEDLVDYLLNSHKGEIIYSGNLENLKDTKVTIGDLIIFQNNTSINGIGIITGFDSNSYPLINTNSVDTYKAPFDLGFGGTNSNFYILSIIK